MRGVLSDMNLTLKVQLQKLKIGKSRIVILVKGLVDVQALFYAVRSSKE